MTEAGGSTQAEARHPGPSSVALPPRIVSELVEHAGAEYPNEACGIVVGSAPAGDGGVPLRFVPATNKARSPYRYEIDPQELLRISLDADDRDETIWGIFHSHTHTAARPSPTDVGLAFYPEALYLLVSLGAEHADPETGAPRVRAWRIVGGGVFEVEVTAGEVTADAKPEGLEAR